MVKTFGKNTDSNKNKEKVRIHCLELVERWFREVG